MAEVNVPVVDDMEVDQDLYEIAYVVNTVLGIADAGMLTEILSIEADRDKFHAIERVGAEFGYSKPSDDRVYQIVTGICMLPYSEEEDDEEETEVQD